MPKLPRPTGKELVRFLENRGFTVTRIRGSHHFLDSGRLRTCVPVHDNASVKTGTLRQILRDINMTPEAFYNAWHNS